MKSIKKIFSILLTLVLSLCMINNVAAANNGSITILNPTEGKTYEIYKIFDLTLGGNNDKIAYTIDGDWTDFFKAGGEGAEYIVDSNVAVDGETSLGLNTITINGEKKYINITEANKVEFTEKALAYIVSKNLTPAENETITAPSDGEIQFTNLALGYYLVYPKGAADIDTENNYATICSLTSTVPTAEVNVKATYPTITKSVDDYSVEVGQTVHFTITGKVPTTTGYESYTYTINDTMSAGLLFNESIANLVVKFVAGNAEKTETPITITSSMITYDNNGFTLTFDMTEYQDYEGQDIIVTYNAKVTKEAIDSDTTKNSATLTYSNDPKDVTKTTTTPPVEKYLYSADILVIKVDGTDQTIELEGAKFVLTKKVGQTTYYYKANLDSNNNLESIQWVTEQSAATEYTTDANGNVTFAGLEDGTYYLVETQAPEGYNLLVTPQEVVVDNAGATDNVIPSIKEISSTVLNNSGTELPTTGGFGTKLFIVIGSLLAVISAVILVTNKRMSKEF